MKNDETILEIKDLSKKYKMGQFGGTSLRLEMQRFKAKLLNKDDPTAIIGQENYVYGEEFWALDNISLSVRRGERLGIIGRNGAGKSTLLKLISRITAPTKGSIILDGRVASMLEVGTGFNGELTGRENIYLNGAILGMKKKEIDEKIEKIIEFSECREFIDTPVKRYSSGMYVKLAFSVAAHLDSEIMIMDEVLAVGDSRFQQKCLAKMREAADNDGKTVLYVSHNMNTIKNFCQRCIVLEDGKIIYDGDVDKAIEYYIGSTAATLAYKEFQPSDHPHLKLHNTFCINSLRVHNPSVQYQSGDKIKLTLNCTSYQPRENLLFRFEISSVDSFMVGTMITETGFSFEENETRDISLEMDLSHIMKGKYVVNIISFIKYDTGEQVFVDGVYPGFTINISADLNEANDLVWLSNDWGNVRLHNIKCQ